MTKPFKNLRKKMSPDAQKTAAEITSHYIDDANENISLKDMCSCDECLGIDSEIPDIDLTNPKDLSFGKKPPLSLVPPTALVHISKAMEDGAKKRSAYNWRESKISVMQMLDKILRHTMKFLDGQDLDEESKLHELAHMLADGCVLLDAIETGCAVDDRPKNGTTAQLIKRLSND